MTKAESETTIHELSRVWADGNGIKLPSDPHVSFSEFKSWLSANGYSHYPQFRSAMGAEHGAELWFDEKTQQTWRK